MTKLLCVGLTVAVLIAAPSCSCADPVDRAAKARIFSPEDPPKVVASAAEKLPPERVADEARVARRILGMGAAETTERLGPHRYVALVRFEWTGAGTVELKEERTLIAAPGGVSGDFHGIVQSSRDQGLEVMRVAGAVYARSRYGKFRQRLRDRGMAEREREEIFGALRDFDALFQGRLKLEPEGTTAYKGRTAWKYVVGLGGPPQDVAAPAMPLPAPVEPKGGRDPSTQRRLLFFEKRRPTSLSGEVLVDAQTSVVLRARLDGRLVVPAEGEQGKAAEVRLVLDSSLTDIGRDPGLKPPEEFLPDADKPQGIAVALDRFGISRTPSPDGGTRLAPSEGGKGDHRGSRGEPEPEKEPEDEEGQ